MSLRGVCLCVHMCMYRKPAHLPGCKFVCLIPSFSSLLCTFWLVIFFFFLFPSPNCHKGSNPARFQAAYWRQTINYWQISMAEMRTRVPYLLGLPGEPASACASSPAAPLTLNYLAAVTTNQSNYRSRTVCSCSYCTASCISFEMYEVYILSLLFI